MPEERKLPVIELPERQITLSKLDEKYDPIVKMINRFSRIALDGQFDERYTFIANLRELQTYAKRFNHYYKLQKLIMVKIDDLTKDNASAEKINLLKEFLNGYNEHLQEIQDELDESFSAPEIIGMGHALDKFVYKNFDKLEDRPEFNEYLEYRINNKEL
ncbi:hypothetical protein DY102_06565 [Apilactobacillus timberlakei]|uniref:hypothetical protein n=1 Tax=Apilactobacillus timberlakei TaxID=2008380 RepID=UPI001127E4E5|nr:hypothetical protein [Apilactobacillus timberlakei]TPR22214.1 hypothetical protein DY102_06565 [Apilactobacillus timberlakei]